MFNVKKFVFVSVCGLLFLVLGACSNGEVVERKKAWYPPSATPDASATPNVDVSPVVGPDPANPHLIPRPFVNAHGSLNRPVEPDLTDHSEQGAINFAVFIMQMREFYSVTGDRDDLGKYIEPDSFTGNRLLDDGEALVAIATATGSVASELQEITAEITDPLNEDGYIVVSGKAKSFYDVEQKFHTLAFGICLHLDPSTNEWLVFELEVNEVS